MNPKNAVFINACPLCGAEIQGTRVREEYLSKVTINPQGRVIAASVSDVGDNNETRVYCANDHTWAQMQEALEAQRESVV